MDDRTCRHDPTAPELPEKHCFPGGKDSAGLHGPVHCAAGLPNACACTLVREGADESDGGASFSDTS